MENGSLSFKEGLNVVLNSLEEGLITKAEALDEITNKVKDAVNNVITDKICIEDAELLYRQHGIYLNCDNGKVKYAAIESGC